MATNLSANRSSEREKERIERFFKLVPPSGRKALDVGARDGHLSKILAQRYECVVALDLQQPQVDHPRVSCVQGDASKLEFNDGEFDLVICAEVLEHIPPALLSKVGKEISRVTSATAVIGVPYKQDLRMARTTCQACGQSNPPWGHVNAFDEHRLSSLFSGLTTVKTDYVGRAEAATNFVSAALMNYAGNPYGTYIQDEACVHCGSAIGQANQRNLPQRLATRAAHWLNSAQAAVSRPQANWMHMRMDRPA